MAALALSLAACGGMVPSSPDRPGRVPTPPRSSYPSSSPTTPPPPANALLAGVRAGPALSSLPFTTLDAAGALASFRESCPRLLSRTDASGLTQPADWRQACVAAANWGNGSSTMFFASYFETARIGDGKAFATGYFEPEIVGARSHLPGLDYPVYGLPSDLVRAKPGDAPMLPNGRMPLGRYDEYGRFTEYFDRGAIEDGALAGKGLEIAWVADPVEFFFLQVQGSGRLRAPDGSILRIGYAGQNGLPYTGIGGVMRDRGLIGSGPGKYPGSMQGIMRYIRENPWDGDALMRTNRSWVFFKVLTGDGPMGALNVPVRSKASVAVDPKFVPLGAPVWLDVDRADATGLWVAQDTGGAIKGANRFDTFWGAGEQARVTAGGMSGRGNALILLPKGTLTRLGVR
ncbi:murein transglycosylase A [Novosphingobium sp. Rr 2-17]|uniref:murein transglycosylase A n=1 Tax=Novosphingobium sp. Rr 2-17 TaxID=555793 RepID=UPI0005BDECCF|nr:murein transglycosylase A [Novosphingobium sp. Rr 2-17]